jgi:hypothetical protein
MKKEVKISISKACGENWTSFPKNNLGGFCERCQKNVIDFTSKTDNEIIDFFSRKSTGVCGRFRPEQLKLYKVESENTGLGKAAIVAAGILALTQMNRAFAHEIDAKEVTEIRMLEDNFSKKDETISNGDTLSYIIKGRVYSIDEKSGIAGANVIVKGTEIGSSSDVNGEFQLPYHGLNKRLTLIISYIGFETLEKEVELRGEVIDIGVIHMVSDVVLLGEVCVYRKWSPRGIWYRIKSIF